VSPCKKVRERLIMLDCHQIVTETAEIQGKTHKLKKTANRAIWWLAKGSS
jgi:hypothetical protein